MKAQSTIIISVVAVFLVGSLIGNYLLYSDNQDLKDKNADLTEEIGGLEDKIASLKKKISGFSLKKSPETRHEHDAELKQLRAQNRERRAKIEDLERQLADQDAAAPEEPIEQPATNRVEGFRRFGPPSRAELEEMREKDPERYVQTTNRIAQFRAGWQERLQNQFDILESADTTHMTEKQRQVHEDYKKLLARIDELGEQLNPLANVSEEQRKAARQEMRETWHQLHELQRVERDTLLTQTANALGFRGRDAREVVEAIKNVYEATGGGHWGRGGRGRGPGGGRHGRH